MSMVSGKDSTCQFQERQVRPWVQEDPWRNGNSLQCFYLGSMDRGA